MSFYKNSDEDGPPKIEQNKLMTLVVGGVLVCVLLFLVGVLVGKMVWETPPEVLKAQTVEAPKKKPIEVSKDELSFYEKLKGPDGEEALPKPVPVDLDNEATTTEETVIPAKLGMLPTSHAQASVEPPPPPVEELKPVEEKPAKAATAQANGSVAKASPKLQEAQAAAPPKDDDYSKIKARIDELARKEDKPEEQKPAPKPAPAGKSFTVQLAAYDKLESAQAEVKKLKGKGVGAEIVQGERNGKLWYKVQSGRFSSQDEAKKFNAKLKAQGLNGMVQPR